MTDTQTLEPPTDPKDAQIQALQEQWATARARHREDIARIGAKLIELADDHGWCDTYDTEVADLNTGLYVELPVREVDYRITFTVTASVTTSASRLDDEVYDIQRDLEDCDHIYDVRHEDTEEE